MEPACADVFGALVHDRGDAGDLLGRVWAKRQPDLLGVKERNVLHEERITRLGKNTDEVLPGQRVEFDANREAALKLGNQIRRLGGVERARGDEQNMIS